MSRPPHNETSRAHAVFLKFRGLLLVPCHGQSTAAERATRSFDSVLWAMPGGGVYTTAVLRQWASDKGWEFEMVTVGGRPR